MAADENAKSDDRKGRVDPRYDPAFQRGYRGEVRRSVQTRAGRGEHAPDALAPRTGVAVDSSVVHEHSHEPADEPADEPAHEPADEQAAGQLMPPPRTNPYVVALWVIGIVLSVGGVLAQWWAQMSQVSGAFSVQNGVPLRVLLISLANTVSGPMITVGMATIVGLIFMLAVRHRSVSSSRADLP